MNPRTSAPRPGLAGAWDRLAGPGATRAENGLNLAWAIGFAAFVAIQARMRGVDWTGLQWGLAIVFAVDLAGGVTMNASPAARRWWHRAGQGPRAHLGFALAHVHPFLVSMVFPALAWRAAAGIYGFMLGATALVLALPHRLRRPAAHALFATGLMLGLLAWPRLPGLEWFAPIYLLKLVLAHLLDDGAEPAAGASTGPGA